MNKTKVLKNIIRIILLACVILTIMQVVVYGANISTGITGTVIGTDNRYKTIASKLLGVVKYICFGAAVIITLVIGVEYMTAAPEGKAEIKKKSIYMAVGAAILFTAGTIVTIVSKLKLFV